MLATEELALEEMALAEEDRSRQGSHRGHAVDDEKFRVRNAPSSGDVPTAGDRLSAGGFHRSSRWVPLDHAMGEPVEYFR